MFEELFGLDLPVLLATADELGDLYPPDLYPPDEDEEDPEED